MLQEQPQVEKVSILYDGPPVKIVVIPWRLAEGPPAEVVLILWRLQQRPPILVAVILWTQQGRPLWKSKIWSYRAARRTSKRGCCGPMQTAGGPKLRVNVILDAGYGGS
jgi:hypothetical protein